MNIKQSKRDNHERTKSITIMTSNFNLLYPLHLRVHGISWCMPAPHLDANENVAKGYEYHRQHVSKSQIANHEE